MHPKYPLKAYDGSTYSDISQFNVSEGAIEPNGVINLISNQNVFDIRDYGAAVDGDEYERTKYHGSGVGHPIIPEP